MRQSTLARCAPSHVHHAFAEQLTGFLKPSVTLMELTGLLKLTHSQEMPVRQSTLARCAPSHVRHAAGLAVRR